MPLGHVAAEISLLAGVGVTLLYALFAPRAKQWVAAPLALVSLAGAGTLTIATGASAGQRLTFSGSWALDDAGAVVTVTILVLAALVVVMSPEWMSADKRHGEYYSVLLLSVLGALVIARANDTMLLLIGILLASVTGYTLAAWHRGSELSVEAGMKYFLIGALTNALLAIGVTILFGLAGSTLYTATQQSLGEGADPLAVLAAGVLVTVGLAFKLGAVPAHAWMPDVAQGAPAPAAGLLTTTGKVAALLALARVVSLLPPGLEWRPVVALVAATTMSLGNLAALWQEDVRRLLGWSAVSQTGYGLLAVVALGRSDLAEPALLVFVVGYGLANLTAFAVVTELRGRTRLADYGGLAWRRPVLVGALAVALLSLVGVPPLIGFAAKLTLFGALIEAGYAWLAALAVANTVVSLFYYLRVLGRTYFTEPALEERVPVLGRWAGMAGVFGAAAVVAAGLFAGPLLGLFNDVLLLPR